MSREAVSVARCYQFLLWAIPKVHKFPRDYKFLLGDRIESSLLDLHELLIEAAYSRRKAQLLGKANLMVEKLRHLFRLAKDLKVLPIRAYEHASRELDELGRQVGGWRKAAGR